MENATKGMCIFIKMEHLVANALVELFEEKNIRRISLEDIYNYGIKVEKELNSENTRAILLYSNIYTKQFLEDYSEWFVREENYIALRPGKTAEDLREHILSYVSLPLLLALFKASPDVCTQNENKETPMKVEITSGFGDMFECPKCNKVISFEEVDFDFKYCPNCGQKLDWSDKNEK